MRRPENQDDVKRLLILGDLGHVVAAQPLKHQEEALAILLASKWPLLPSRARKTGWTHQNHNIEISFSVPGLEGKII